MMRQRHSASHHVLTRFDPDKRVEQTVTVKMGQLMPSIFEADPTKAMDAQRHAKGAAGLTFERFSYAERTAIEENRRHQQHRIKNLRRAGDGREPFQPPNYERENHEPLFSIGARSATDGPFNTLPSASKREPWQGQSHVVSVRFQCTMHFKCGQTAVISWSVPDSSR